MRSSRKRPFYAGLGVFVHTLLFCKLVLEQPHIDIVGVFRGKNDGGSGLCWFTWDLGA